MTINKTEIEVRYQETDQMGIVYHANYLVWFEIGRTKFMEQLGFRYAMLEEQGMLSPVIDIQVSYKRPARYGDTVTVKTWLDNYDGIRTIYAYQITNQQNELLVTGKSEHVIVDKESFKPLRLRNVQWEWHNIYKSEIKGER